MISSYQLRPRTLGLFEKRIAGDDSLTELARLRFSQAGMGAEMHARTTEELDGLLKFQPSPNAPVIVHLPRDFNLMDEHAGTLILDFASSFAGRAPDSRLGACPPLCAASAAMSGIACVGIASSCSSSAMHR